MCPLAKQNNTAGRHRHMNWREKAHGDATIGQKALHRATRTQLPPSRQCRSVAPRTGGSMRRGWHKKALQKFGPLQMCMFLTILDFVVDVQCHPSTHARKNPQSHAPPLPRVFVPLDMRSYLRSSHSQTTNEHNSGNDKSLVDFLTLTERDDSRPTAPLPAGLTQAK